MTPAPSIKPAEAPPMATGDDTGPDAAVIRRFETLNRLRDEGLIAADEYEVRRNANLGALLPYYDPPPARGLDTPAPGPGEVVDRMKALVEAYQGRSISAIQQQTERNIILDGLLPGPSARRAEPPPPITSSVMAAAAVGRMVRMRDDGLISAEEETKGQTAVFAQLTEREEMLATKMRQAQGLRPVGEGLRLGTYASDDKALAGWTAMQKKFPDMLGSLQPVVEKVEMRRGGVVWRLSAGPLADRKTALAICRILTRQRLSCVPTVLK
jgi:hypothetical protein